MPRLMSVAYTEEQVRARTKRVTRRAGWTHAKKGDRLILCRKVMGRQGAPLVRIVTVEVLDVRRERLARLLEEPSSYGPEEVALEGFPGMLPHDFVHQFFVDAQGIYPSDEVTRIEWRYLEDHCVRCGEPTSAAWRTSEEWEASRYCALCLLGPVPS